MTIAKVLENTVENGVRYLKGLVFGEIDTKKSILLSSFGDDFNVPNGYKALFINTSNNSEPVCIGFINKVIIDNLASGSKQISSTNSIGDTIAAYIKLINDGTMHFNGDADNVSGFNDLKIGFDELKKDFNNLVSDYNSHNHIYTTPLHPSAPGSTTGSQSGSTSSASIDDCKKDNIKIE